MEHHLQLLFQKREQELWHKAVVEEEEELVVVVVVLAPGLLEGAGGVSQ